MAQFEPVPPAWQGVERRSGTERRQGHDRREEFRYDLTRGDRRGGEDRRRRGQWAGSANDRW